MTRWLAIAALGSFAWAYAQSQPDPNLTFEAASVKPVAVRAGPFHFKVLPNRLDAKNLSLGYFIRQAFDLAVYQTSGPEWLETEGFDIAATSGRPVSSAEMRAMLANLLKERFHLASHWETRTESVFRLVSLPAGPKMKAADEGFAMANSPLRDGNSMQLSGPMSMRQLAASLARFTGKTVVDATGLDGYFTIKLAFAPDDYDPSKDNGAIAPPPLMKAIEEQLGLKLVSAKDAIRVMVIDHADKTPSAN